MLATSYRLMICETILTYADQSVSIGFYCTGIDSTVSPIFHNIFWSIMETIENTHEYIVHVLAIFHFSVTEPSSMYSFQIRIVDLLLLHSPKQNLRTKCQAPNM